MSHKLIDDGAADYTAAEIEKLVPHMVKRLKCDFRWDGYWGEGRGGAIDDDGELMSGGMTTFPVPDQIIRDISNSIVELWCSAKKLVKSKYIHSLFVAYFDTSPPSPVTVQKMKKHYLESINKLETILRNTLKVLGAIAPVVAMSADFLPRTFIFTYQILLAGLSTLMTVRYAHIPVIYGLKVGMGAISSTVDVGLGTLTWLDEVIQGLITKGENLKVNLGDRSKHLVALDELITKAQEIRDINAMHAIFSTFMTASHALDAAVSAVLRTKTRETARQAMQNFDHFAESVHTSFNFKWSVDDVSEPIDLPIGADMTNPIDILIQTCLKMEDAFASLTMLKNTIKDHPWAENEITQSTKENLLKKIAKVLVAMHAAQRRPGIDAKEGRPAKKSRSRGEPKSAAP